VLSAWLEAKGNHQKLLVDLDAIRQISEVNNNDEEETFIKKHFFKNSLMEAPQKEVFLINHQTPL